MIESEGGAHSNQDSTAAQLLQALAAHLNGALNDADHAIVELEQAFENMEPIRAMFALQFHDRLEQQIRHVSGALVQIAQLIDVQSDGHGASAESWTMLAQCLADACPVERDKGRYPVAHTGSSTHTNCHRSDALNVVPGDIELY